ncbi:MAG TPA: 4-(cytidine 5'-diphospho)-2-C-methyl-D-erythritol kinase [Ruminococcus sp.]|nr:4-(cytidine 5'-diphospho)-2-C-methyl-D-erythritol kinase [Ruminococcus sp.]
MNKHLIALQCASKINLSLDVTGKRPDGYHTLESIFQSVGVYDDIEIRMEEGKGLSFSCNLPDLPTDERNLAVKAVSAFLQYSGKQAKIDIRLKKNIPSGAGMGGGSADAGGVIFALNRLFHTNYSNEILCEIGLQVGADVPFILMGGTAYVEGIGEIIQPLKPLPEIPVIIVKGEESVSTPVAYRAIDALENPVHPDTRAMLQAIQNQDIPALCQNCGNLFEQAVSCQEVIQAKKSLLELGASCAVMTGSGSAVFGLFPHLTYSQTQELLLSLKENYTFADVTTFKNESFNIIQCCEEI